MIQTLRGYWNIAISDLRYQGVQVLLWRMVVKLMLPVLRLDLQILFQMDLSQPVPARQARVECTVEQAGEDDVDAILDMQMQLRPADEIGQLSDELELQYIRLQRVRAEARRSYLGAMRAGERCYIGRVDGVIAHSNWIRFHDNAHVDGRPVDLKAGEVYTTDAFTADAFRGKGLHEVVLAEMLRVAQLRGAHRAYTITDLTKAGSRRGVQRLGWVERGKILYVTPRGLNRSWLLRVAGDLEPLFDHARAAMAQR